MMSRYLNSAPPGVESRVQLESRLESQCWPPWLQTTASEIDEFEALFPAGQFVMWDAEAPSPLPVAALRTTLVGWDGLTESIPTWDEIAGVGRELLCVPGGNTMAFISMSVRAEHNNQGLASQLVSRAIAQARELGLDFVIGDFRPNAYAEARRARRVPFAGYVAEKRTDGLPVDPWLRAVTRLGFELVAHHPGAMVVECPMSQWNEYRSDWNADSWTVVGPDQAKELLGPDSPDLTKAYVWDCGETGLWITYPARGTATYYEDNIAGVLRLHRTGS